MPILKVRDGININYVVGGDPNARNKVLFVMGLNASHRQWDFQFEYFSSLPDYQVLVFDNRGAGFSDIPEPPYTMTQMVNDVIDLANELHWEKFHLIGCSMGGMIVQHVALEHPERILSLTLICTRVEGGFFKSLPTFEGTIKFLRIAKATDPEVLLRTGAELQFPLEYLSQKNPEGITYREYFYNLMKKRMADVPMTTPKGKEGQLAVVKAHGLSQDQMKKLKDSKFPILALTGDSDILIRSSHSYSMPELIGAKLVVLKGHGHGLVAQSPEIINQHIKDFIEEANQKHAPVLEDNIVLSK
eukprot:TRINITY_DN635_c0_g1_i6.p1 TRINITY_DN635_c0_g1~~TRINITY_DN635_c0_g1_i6.p1  ORF type:complete len:302 (-),score=59.76 TRINITY_DN635_c0_g1_i6:224-1129(-)